LGREGERGVGHNLHVGGEVFQKALYGVARVLGEEDRHVSGLVGEVGGLFLAGLYVNLDVADVL